LTRHVGSRESAFATKREIETEIARGTFLGYGVEMEVLQTDVAVRTKKFAKPEGPGKGVRALPLEEIRALLAAAKEHTPSSFHAFLMCAATTGMRAGELRALRWSDVNLADGSIVVSKSAAVRLRDPDGPTKGGKPRTVYMTGELRKVMVEHRRLPEEALKKRWGAVPEYVFPSTEGGMMNKCSYRR